VIQIGHRPQRTLARPVEINGIGFVTGCRVTVRFLPLPAGSGISFERIDLPDAAPIAARAESVTATQRRTTLGEAPNQVTMVEHVLSALAGMRIDNCLIEIDGPEPPGLDGSAQGFVDALVDGGVVLQTERRPIWSVTEPMTLEQSGATLSLHPSAGNDLRCSYILEYGPDAAIAPQTYSATITPESYRHGIAPCRTFLLEQEARELQKQGVGRHVHAGELVVFGARGPVGNALRYPNEPARHKVLDLVGDLSLAGVDLAGHIVAYRSGHTLNVMMAKALRRLTRGNGCSEPARVAA
jgi:UDP-3-O-acyl N-acetylglucosamine deacetylase